MLFGLRSGCSNGEQERVAHPVVSIKFPYSYGAHWVNVFRMKFNRDIYYGRSGLFTLRNGSVVPGGAVLRFRKDRKRRFDREISESAIEPREVYREEQPVMYWDSKGEAVTRSNVREPSGDTRGEERRGRYRAP